MTIRIGINGFGRMGRLTLRAAWGDPDLRFVRINDPAGDPATLAHLLMCDLFVGWGASADVVAKTMTLVDQLGEVAPLAPPIAPVPAAV